MYLANSFVFGRHYLRLLSLLWCVRTLLLLYFHCYGYTELKETFRRVGERSPLFPQRAVPSRWKDPLKPSPNAVDSNKNIGTLDPLFVRFRTRVLVYVKCWCARRRHRGTNRPRSCYWKSRHYSRKGHWSPSLRSYLRASSRGTLGAFHILFSFRVSKRFHSSEQMLWLISSRYSLRSHPVSPATRL